MQIKNKIFALILMMTMSMYGYSQSISGFVYEQSPSGKKLPLTGVNVYWLGTSKGTFTDEKGNFQLSKMVSKNSQLVISFLGYKKELLKIGRNDTHVEVELHTDNQQLGTVEIKERKDNTSISKINPIATQLINTGELQRAACCNLAESFETNASVDVSYGDAITGAKQIQLLGLSGIYSQIMTENIPLIRGMASTYGLNYIPGPWMESIQISKGTASVVNGYESVTGQINVEYKKPENSEKLYVNLFGNSNGRMEANINSTVKLNDKLSTIVMLHGDDSRQTFDRNHDGFMDLPKLTTYNFFNRWDYINPGKWVSRLGIKYLDEDRNGGQMDFRKKDFTNDTTGISDNTKKYGFGVKTKRLEAFWKNGFFFKNHPDASVGIILSGVNHEQKSFYGLNPYNSHERSFYANFLFQTNIKNKHHKIVTGLSYLLDDYRESFLQTQLQYLYQLNQDTSARSLFTLADYRKVNYNMNRTEIVPGAFVEYTFNYHDKFTMIAGLRSDYNSLYEKLLVTPRLHLRYKFNESVSLRGSVGKGYRTANVFAENGSIFVSQRELVFVDKLKQEEAWNYGLNFAWDFKLFGNKADLSLDAYRTDFINQVVVDMDSLPTKVFFYNLDGKSYANSLQAQLTMEPVKRLTLTMAFRLNDVKTTIDGKLREKPFVNKYKGLVTVSYATRFEKWRFDLTGQFNGSTRIPDTQKMPVKLQRAENSPAYFSLLGQINRKFKFFEVYLGGENLTNFTQNDPITEYQYPYHSHFDASMVWGPIVQWSLYAGVRISIK